MEVEKNGTAKKIEVKKRVNKSKTEIILFHTDLN